MPNDNFYDRPDKKWKIEFEDGTILENKDIYLQHSLEIHQTLCEDEQLTFGSCISDYVVVKLLNNGTSYMGKRFTLKIMLEDYPSAECQIGVYRVIKEEVSGDKSNRTVTAYDALYDIFDVDVAGWYNSLHFPITVYEMRNSFFNYLGLNQDVTSTLIFDSKPIQKTIVPESMTAKAFITRLCEMNGCFGHINSNGDFEFIYLKEYKDGLIPSLSLVPSTTLIPSLYKNDFGMDVAKYVTEKHEDYKISKIDKLQIRQEENDIGCVYGTGENCYIIQDNFFFYGLGAAQLTEYAQRIYDTVSKVSYTPCSITAVGNPSLKVGEGIHVESRHGNYSTYILKRVMKGTLSLRDEISAKGLEKREEKANGLNESIIQMRGKYNKLVRNVDGLISEVYDSATGASRIEQNAREIQARVTSVGGNASSFGWNLTANGFVLSSGSKEVFRCDPNGINVNGYASVDLLAAVDARVGSLEADHVTTQQLNATNAKIDDLTAKSVTTDNLSSKITAMGSVNVGQVFCSEYHVAFMVDGALRDIPLRPMRIGNTIFLAFDVPDGQSL